MVGAGAAFAALPSSALASEANWSSAQQTVAGQAAIRSQVHIHSRQRELTPPLHSRQYAHSRNVKIIWWNPYLTPQQITPQDLSNGSQAFDGFVVQLVRGTQDDPKHNEQLCWGAFSDKHYTLDGSGDDIHSSLTALENMPLTPMSIRMLRINSAPYSAAHFNWVDDNFWYNVASNMDIASQICAGAGLYGVYFDDEEYNRNLYNYNKIKDDPRYAGMSYDDMAAIAEKRGRQVIQALNGHVPNLNILFTFGYTYVSQHGSRANLSKNGSLLVPFLDGMLDGSTRSTRFIDGSEFGFWHDDTPNYFSNWRKTVLDPNGYNGKFQKYGDRYQNQYEVDYGLFLDRDRPVNSTASVYGWCGGSKSQLFYSPARWAYTVQEAVKNSDRFVWVYTQTPDAWLAPGSGGLSLPSAYVRAMRDGQRHGNDPSMPSLSPDNSTANVSDYCSK